MKRVLPESKFHLIPLGEVGGWGAGMLCREDPELYLTYWP